MKLGKFMEARAVGIAPHEAYVILSATKDVLGMVEWYPHWKQYAFNPECLAWFSQDCLRELADFCERLAKEST